MRYSTRAFFFLMSYCYCVVEPPGGGAEEYPAKAHAAAGDAGDLGDSKSKRSSKGNNARSRGNSSSSPGRNGSVSQNGEVAAEAGTAQPGSAKAWGANSKMSFLDVSSLTCVVWIYMCYIVSAAVNNVNRSSEVAVAIDIVLGGVP